MNTSTSLFAKALATENIFVSFNAEAKTASFDVESRTLTIPDWKVTDALRDMIVAHEVAHALYTPPQQFFDSMAAAKDRKMNLDGYKACLNVIEDARIERLIKEKFPGCRRDFYAGYKEIHDTDLFQLNSIRDEDFTIVDKINLHFKFGLFGLRNITVTDAEQAIIDRVAAAKTYEDVVAIADELYAMAAEEEKEKKKTSMFGVPGDLTKALADSQEGEEQQSNNPGTGYNTKNFPYMSYPLPKANSDIGIIPYATVLDEVRHAAKQAHKESNDAEFLKGISEANKLVGESLDAFRKESASSVKELVAQFERRKAAEEIRNERMKPTGTINPDRLHQFKTHDDIFLRNLIRYDGKKHGMVFLIDWSGSMSECIDGVIRQTLLLVWFCRKAKIPYEVFTYTEMGMLHTVKGFDFAKRFKDLYDHKKAAESLDIGDVGLREVLSSKMTDEEHGEMEHMLWLYAQRLSIDFRNAGMAYYLDGFVPNILGMHGTPTCEALMVMHDYLPKFRSKTGAQVVDFILMTDGDPTGLCRTGNHAYSPVKGVRIQHLATGRTLTIQGDVRGHINTLQIDVQYFLADEIRRLGVVTVGFSIGSVSGLSDHLVVKFVDQKCRRTYRSNPGSPEEARFKEYNEFYKRENFIPASPEQTPGFDEYYVIRPVKPNLSEDETTAKGGTPTLTRIRNQFIKSMVNRKVSKVFLSRFVDLIAGRKVKKFRV